jgi:hypothetical protein
LSLWKVFFCFLNPTRTGSGKSTTLNLLLGQKATISKLPIGAMHIEFAQHNSTVGAGIHSETLFPVIVPYQKGFLVDFPGFMENRAGQLEVERDN